MTHELRTLSIALLEHAALLRFSGILSLRDVTDLKSSLKQLMRKGYIHLLLDLEETGEIDEAGWAVLVSTVRKLRRLNGRAAIRGCSDELYERLRARKWDREFLFPLRKAEHMAALPADLQAFFKPGVASAGA